MADRYWIGNGGTWDASDTTHWSTASGGSGGASVPGSADNAIFDDQSFTTSGQTVTLSTSPSINSMTWANVTNGPTFYSGTDRTITVTGNVAFAPSSNMTLNITNLDIDVKGTGSYTLTTGGNVFRGLDVGSVAGSSPTVTLQDDLTVAGTASPNVTVTRGSLDSAGHDITIGDTSTGGQFSSSNSNTRTVDLEGSDVVVYRGGINNTAWNFATTTGLSFTAPASITIKANGTATYTFAGGGLTYNNVTLASSGARNITFTISGSNTFGTLAITPWSSSYTATVNFIAGSTQTVSGFSATGASGKLITLQSKTAGSAWTISKASGTVVCDYLSVQDSTATGGASWYAGSHSTNVSGNSGWSFTDPATVYTETLTETATSVSSVTDLQTWVDTLTAQAVSVSTVTDLQQWVDTLATSITSVSTVADLQAYIEVLADTITSQSAVADGMVTVEVVSDLAGSVASVTDVQTVVETVTAVAGSATSVTDIQTFVEILTATIVSVSSVTDVQTWLEDLAGLAQSSAAVIDLQTYVESVTALIGSVASVTDTKKYFDDLHIIITSTASITEVMHYVEIASATGVSSAAVVEFMGSYIHRTVTDPWSSMSGALPFVSQTTTGRMSFATETRPI